MHMELSKEECEVLVELIHHELSDLGSEVRRTRTSSYRDEIKEWRNRLRDLEQRLTTEADITQ